MVIARSVVIKGATIGYLIPQVIALCIFSVLLLAIAACAFRKTPGLTLQRNALMIRPRLTGKPRLILVRRRRSALLAGSIWLLLRPHSAAANTLRLRAPSRPTSSTWPPRSAAASVCGGGRGRRREPPGKTLLVLDDAALKAQQASAQASLDLAQANYDLLTAPRRTNPCDSSGRP